MVITDNLEGLLKDLNEVTEEELARPEEIATRQLNYISPLKQATQARRNRIGKNNLLVLKKVRELQEQMRQSKDLVE